MADKKISQLTGASTPLAGTEVLPIVQSGSTVKVASDDLTVKNVRSNATTGILQIAGPGAGATRVMTTPNANFTAARTDAAQTFTGSQTFSSGAQLTFSGITGNVSLDVPFPASSNAKSQLLFTGTGDYRQTVKLKLNKDQADNAPVDVMQFGPGVDVTVSAGNLVVGTAAKGIDFSANSHAAGMTSELLNWYEEGTWTPTDASGASLTFTSATGRYTRVGNVVFLFGFVQYPVTASGANASIGGLPFTVNSNSSALQGAVTYSQVATVRSIGVNPSTTNTTVYTFAGAAVTNATLSGTVLYFNSTYFV